MAFLPRSSLSNRRFSCTPSRLQNCMKFSMLSREKKLRRAAFSQQRPFISGIGWKRIARNRSLKKCILREDEGIDKWLIYRVYILFTHGKQSEMKYLTRNTRTDRYDTAPSYTNVNGSLSTARLLTPFAFPASIAVLAFSWITLANRHTTTPLSKASKKLSPDTISESEIKKKCGPLIKFILFSLLTSRRFIFVSIQRITQMASWKQPRASTKWRHCWKQWGSSPRALHRSQILPGNSRVTFALQFLRAFEALTEM